jgi:hypothetical protein
MKNSPSGEAKQQTVQGDSARPVYSKSHTFFAKLAQAHKPWRGAPYLPIMSLYLYYFRCTKKTRSGLQRMERFVYTHAQRRDDPAVQELRKTAGAWLRSLRERKGLSQRDLASQVGAEYYTFISQLETGRGRIPPDRYESWAGALGVNPRSFVKTLMSYYDPVTYRVLFEDDSVSEARSI